MGNRSSAIPAADIQNPSFISIWKEQAFWFILLLYFAYGAVNNFLPVTFPVFKQYFQATLEGLGRIQLLFFIVGLLFSFVGGWFVDSLGLKWSTVVTLVSLALSMVFIGVADRFWVVQVGSVLFGMAIAALVVVYSAIVCECYPTKRQSVFLISGVTGGVGGILGPAAEGKWLLHASRTSARWGDAYYVAAALLGLFVLWAMLLPPGLISQNQSSGDLANGMHDDVKKSILRDPALHGIGLAYCLHGVGQSGMLSWVGLVFQSRHPINSAQAAYFISFELIGVFAGRSALTWITARWKIPDLLLLGVCAIISTVAFSVTLLSSSYAGGVIAFAVAGFFVSGNGPAISSYIGLRFRNQTATAFSILGGIGNIGSAGGPYLVGVLGGKLGLETAIWLMPLCMFALALFAFGWYLQLDAQDRATGG